MSRFIAVDVKTANTSKATICHVAFAAFENRSLVLEWSALVDPESKSDVRNIRIHGITPELVGGKPTGALVFDQLTDSLLGQVLASHDLFDAHAFADASKRYGLETPSCSWIDISQVVGACVPNTIISDGRCFARTSKSKWDATTLAAMHAPAV